MKTFSEKKLQQAVAVLRRGGIVAYPTEAVFGLGCDPQQAASIDRLLQIKQRPVEKGLILVASEVAQLVNYLDTDLISDDRWQQVIQSWPGPVTWLLPAKQNVPRLIRGEHKTIAVRVSAHPLVQQLCREFGSAIISTSANKTGQPPAKSVAEVWQQFGDSIDCIVDGEVGGADKPTEIREALSGKIIRPANDKEIGT